jgi:sulfoxide reductase catalytic subunit YedY
VSSRYVAETRGAKQIRNDALIAGLKKETVTVKSRRKFIALLMQYLAAAGMLLSPLYAFLRRAAAEAAKRVLPPGFDLQRLVNSHPGSVDTHNVAPMPLETFQTMGLSEHEIDLDRWRLAVAGRVGRALALTYDEILEMPSLQRKVLLICPGVFTNLGLWQGVSIRTLLERAEAEPGITHVTLRGPRGPYEMVERFPMADVKADKVFLAYRVNGNPLPIKHGYPLRVIAEGEYGFRWVKYVYRVEADAL